MAIADQRAPEYWRGRAAEARAMLEQARDPKVRTYLAEIAREYDKLAGLAEPESSAMEDTPTRPSKG